MTDKKGRVYTVCEDNDCGQDSTRPVGSPCLQCGAPLVEWHPDEPRKKAARRERKSVPREAPKHPPARPYPIEG